MKKVFDAYQVSLGMTLVIAGTVLSFRDFFLVNPFEGNLGLVGLLQTGALISLICLVFVPPYLLSGTSTWTKQQFYFFIFSAVAWPVSLMLVRIAVWRATDVFVVDYWFSYPILFLCEYAPATIYVYMASVSKKKSSEQTHNKRSSHLTRQFAE